MAENKTKATKVSVAAFIAAVADQTRRADAKALVKLMQSATGEKPKMWGPSIIGFGSYHYTYDSGREGDMPLVGFSPRKAATVLYITRAFSGSVALLANLLLTVGFMVACFGSVSGTVNWRPRAERKHDQNEDL